MNLRKRLAEFGFESNDDYEYPLRCLFEATLEHLRCVDVCGESGRRKTAFANALAHALEYPHILYYDFTQPEPPAPPLFVAGEDEGGPQAAEAPLSAFERAVTEACAFSEAERTILILDQLQVAEFRDQIRLYHFVQSGEWKSSQGAVTANRKNLLLALISEDALYHSLAKVSFRIYADPSNAFLDYRPDDFGLPQDAREFMSTLSDLFRSLGASPTHSEYARILADVHTLIRTEDQLRHSIYGWTERIDRNLLFSAHTAHQVHAAVAAINRYIGLDHIEMGG